jgi:hypothetical protein
MVEYHGWITLRDTSSHEETNEDRLAVLAALVQQEIERRSAPHRIIGMKTVNANYFVWFAGCTNHWSSDVDDLFELLKFIATQAPGSYGLLYLWDDEDRRHENEFRVWKLAKGTVSEQVDPFLSPCVPTIEDGEEVRQPTTVR